MDLDDPGSTNGNSLPSSRPHEESDPRNMPPDNKNGRGTGCTPPEKAFFGPSSVDDGSNGALPLADTSMQRATASPPKNTPHAPMAVDTHANSVVSEDADFFSLTSNVSDASEVASVAPPVQASATLPGAKCSADPTSAQALDDDATMVDGTNHEDDLKYMYLDPPPKANSKGPSTTLGSNPTADATEKVDVGMGSSSGFASVAGSPDLAEHIPNFYRILDLVSETGSGGLVDKVIISQESLGRYMNAISPGSYTSLTKVDFKALDNHEVEPVGLYGSQSAMIDFLQENDVIDAQTTKLLRQSSTDTATTSSVSLSSGLYLLRTAPKEDGAKAFVVYWPEDNTWNDDAESSVRRNRVTFMRYLTKMTHQIIACISPAQSSRIVWREGVESDSMEIGDEDETDRLYTFEVMKTKEEEENATACPGFVISHPTITHPSMQNIDLDPSLLEPRLLTGETCIAFMTGVYVPSKVERRPLDGEYTPVHFQNIIDKKAIQLSEFLSPPSIGCLLQNGLERLVPVEAKALRLRLDAIQRESEELRTTRREEAQRHMENNRDELACAVEEHLTAGLNRKFPVLSYSTLDDPLRNNTSSSATGGEGRDILKGIVKLYPEVQKLLDDTRDELESLGPITPKPYMMSKERICLIDLLLQEQIDGVDDESRAAMIATVLESNDLDKSAKLLTAGSVDEARSWFTKISGYFQARPPDHWEQLRQASKRVSNPRFLLRLPTLLDREPQLAEAAMVASKHARKWLDKKITNKSKSVAHHISHIQLQQVHKLVDIELKHFKDKEMETAHRQFLREVEIPLRSIANSPILRIDGAEEANNKWHSSSYRLRVRASQEWSTDPAIQYEIRVLELMESDKHRIQVDRTFIPTPRIRPNSTVSFHLPLSRRIVHAQMLGEHSHCLLITEDSSGSAHIYLERFDTLGGAVASVRHTKVLHADKLGQNALYAFDESKRMLAVCTSSSSQINLHVFVADERFTSLRGLGSPFNLSAWYDPGTTISHITFVSGSGEEIVLIDSKLRARIFSFATQQFRPSSIMLNEAPTSVTSTPDGSCLMIATAVDGRSSLYAFHWTNFGSTAGIAMYLGEYPLLSCISTSLASRTNVHFVILDGAQQQCVSFALSITRRATEFSFKEKGKGKGIDNPQITATAHNSLIDCHADVWTRFPVVPAIRRQTITAGNNLQRRSLILSTITDHDQFPPYWRELIDNFERNTRKPTEKELSGIKAVAMEPDSVLEYISGTVSRFKAGQWLVDLLCLIPIHLAITRDNRFVPLKDGVSSADLERTLLGATVDQIIDNLSFGWYESIFRSYMVSKPVKVVSSMGEQSVGKSFALNHLADTSFAGSAMRTTEGVWMSVNPTEEALIVALDFEGVHSIERSAQEDTLLVLFNTAISNLVLFRNNFALSRDITGLFQSFQSSSSVLDPSANPALFNSTLVIIIKDVVDSDKKEITKEFQLKFQSIVAQEQEANFISRLHRGRLNIIPWPVIESKQFYALFPTLKKCLDREPVTHPQAGLFIQTLKTLMAKIKANDWGSLDQNMASHRCQHLAEMMNVAIASGLGETEPEIEPLKNLDTNEALFSEDSKAMFYLHALEGSVIAAADQRLLALQASWLQFGERFDHSEDNWVRDLSSYLDQLVHQRIAVVDSWIAVNTARFAEHSSVQDLRREFDRLSGDVKASVQMCRLKCSSCSLQCLNVRHHSDSFHSCSTNHKCPRTCEYMTDHDSEDAKCGLPAGHDGSHICDASAHLCGHACSLADKGNCMGSCSKPSGHKGDAHLCQARYHECGHPCSLKGIRLSNGSLFSCPETCKVPSDQTHSQHACGSRSCSLPCQLCGRLCSNSDHLHGLQSASQHLCGQSHPCMAFCESEGVCMIETAPLSVKASFTGQHGSFQYTKYSQVHKRLLCAVQIPQGKTRHTGPHVHTVDQKPFHFCKATCENCGYYCQLPFGHSQPDHETSHGSMSKTQWAVEDSGNNVIEVDGRKFGAGDEGAPMLCNLVCKSMGRHVHVDYCRATAGPSCSGQGLMHLQTRMTPNPDRPKDLITHSLFWRRSGFKDPYSQEDQRTFAKCDAQCAGPEHTADAQAQPSYCTLPIFHPPHRTDQVPPGGGYVSGDGHLFNCRNPAVQSQAFHVIFVIDRSGSMGYTDRRPLQGTPTTQLIQRYSNNRLGSVYSALYAFWSSRHAAINAATTQGGATANRRDAYSVILFDNQVATVIDNDFQSSPDELLNVVLQHQARGGTNYTLALQEVQVVMERHWSTERQPIVIFLSDGECSVSDTTVQDLCRRTLIHNTGLSLQAVAFGPSNAVLRRMAQVAADVQSRAPPNAMRPPVPSAYSEALDSVKLAETFLGIADSLRKPRGALMRG